MVGMIGSILPIIGEWLQEHEALFGWLVALSISTLVLSILTTPFIVVRMREDYFLEDRQIPEDSFREQHPVLRLAALSLKNLLGFILFLAGVAMLALPGQGLLTILMGLLLMNFPGKRSIELRIMSISSILKSVNWIRAKAGRPPLKIPPR
jgi:hypothetical protein